MRYCKNSRKNFPAANYMFKVNNRNTRTRCEICCSKLTIKTSERWHWRRFGVVIVNFEHISPPLLVFLWAGKFRLGEDLNYFLNNLKNFFLKICKWNTFSFKSLLFGINISEYTLATCDASKSKLSITFDKKA